MKTDVLIVDDDASIRSVIAMALQDAGMRVHQAANGSAALVAQCRNPCDLVVLDIGMPELDGFETCQALRKFSNVPVVFLTARDEEIDRVLGFQLGGDDYVTKPFSPRELVLRIKAILGRTRNTDPEEQTSHGQLLLRHGAHQAFLGERELELTGMEFTVLKTFASRPDQVFTRDQLIHAVYGHNSQLSDRTVDSHVRNIRQKARSLGFDDIIRTIHGVGLRLGTCET